MRCKACNSPMTQAEMRVDGELCFVCSSHTVEDEQVLPTEFDEEDECD